MSLLVNANRRPRPRLCGPVGPVGFSMAISDSDSAQVTGLPAVYDGQTPEAVAWINSTIVPLDSVGVQAGGIVGVDIDGTLEDGDVLTVVFYYPGQVCPFQVMQKFQP
jgi:hypothetical protein